MLRLLLIFFCFTKLGITHSELTQNPNSATEDDCADIQEISINAFNEYILPSMEGKHKGEAGKICIIGGSAEYTGAPYFSAIAALKVGADLVYVITTEDASLAIKSYSPDLIVLPYLDKKYIDRIVSLITKMDVIVIGPGLGRENETLSLIHDIIRTCKVLMKPLVIDADGLFALSRDISVLEEYPSPGVILTPNYFEAERLKRRMPLNMTSWYHYWGENVSVLQKGHMDTFYTSVYSLQWHIVGGGSGRRVGGQGDILSGSLATFFNWAIKANLCADKFPHQLAQSLASYAASNLTRVTNFKAYLIYGRSLLASDMINELHNAFEFLINRNLNK